MKKRKQWWMFLLPWILIILIGVLPYAIFSYGVVWKFNADYNTYSDEFRAIASYLFEYFLDAKYQDGYFTVQTKKIASDQTEVELVFHGAIKEEIFFLSKEISKAFLTVQAHGFPNKDSGLGRIYIEKDQIWFTIEKGFYALVYAPNGRPSRSHWEKHDIRIRRIEKDWYHVRAK